MVNAVQHSFSIIIHGILEEEKMKKKLIAIVAIAMLFSLLPVGVFAKSKSASASHHGVTYTTTNKTDITRNKKGNYVTTTASFKWKSGVKALGGKDVLSHSISSGFLMTSGSGSVKMKPVSVKICVAPGRGRGSAAKFRTISVSNTKALRQYLTNASIKKIRDSGYTQKLRIIEKDSGKTYALFNSKVSKSGLCKSKKNRAVTVNYEARSGSYTINWRTATATKVYSYNAYTNYAYNSLGLTPKVSFKGWDLALNSTMVKGNCAVLRITPGK